MTLCCDVYKYAPTFLQAGVFILLFLIIRVHLPAPFAYHKNVLQRLFMDFRKMS